MTQQVLATTNTTNSQFANTLQKYLDHGWRIVPGTMQSSCSITASSTHGGQLVVCIVVLEKAD